MGFRPPLAMALIAGLSELAGVLFALGLVTPFAALAHDVGDGGRGRIGALEERLLRRRTAASSTTSSLCDGRDRRRGDRPRPLLARPRARNRTTTCPACGGASACSSPRSRGGLLVLSTRRHEADLGCAADASSAAGDVRRAPTRRRRRGAARRAGRAGRGRAGGTRGRRSARRRRCRRRARSSGCGSRSRRSGASSSPSARPGRVFCRCPATSTRHAAQLVVQPLAVEEVALERVLDADRDALRRRGRARAGRCRARGRAAPRRRSREAAAAGRRRRARRARRPSRRRRRAAAPPPSARRPAAGARRAARGTPPPARARRR